MLKHPKAVPEITTLELKYKWYKISCLNSYFRHATFLYSFKCSSGHQSFFNIRFSSRKSQSQQKLAKKITHFTIQFRSKTSLILRTSTPLDIENSILPQHSQKPFWFNLFHQTCFCLGSEKNLHCTIYWRPRTPFLKHFERKCLHISVYLRKKFFVPET